MVGKYKELIAEKVGAKDLKSPDDGEEFSFGG